MTDHSKEQHGSQHEHHQKSEHARKRPIHHKWGFWAAIVLMLIAMAVYVGSMNEEFLPGNQGHQPVPAAP
jgi:hypothetical protein